MSRLLKGTSLWPIINRGRAEKLRRFLVEAGLALGLQSVLQQLIDTFAGRSASLRALDLREHLRLERKDRVFLICANQYRNRMMT